MSGKQKMVAWILLEVKPKVAIMTYQHEHWQEVKQCLNDML